MMEDAILQQLVVTEEGFKMIENHLINIESGLQILMYIAIAFLVWAVIRAIYKLFGGIFFGGV